MPAGGGARRACPARRAGDGAPPPGRGRAGRRLAPALAAVAGLLLYLPSLSGGFVWDDHLLVEQNPLLRSGAGLARAVTSDFWAASGGAGASGLWRPLVSLSYAAEGALSGWDPRLFHLSNALAHAGVSALVAALALAAGVSAPGAALAGLLFATMPAHVESVAWISGRTDVWCALLLLLALLLDRRARVRGRRWPGVAPPVALALALLAKETALPFLLVVGVAEWTAPRPGRARWLLPYALVTLAYLVAHQAWAPGGAGGAAVARSQLLPALALMFPGYLAFAWPWFPHTPAVTLEAGRAAAWMAPAAAVLQGLFVLGVLWLARRRHAVALPLALFWLTLLPTVLVDAARGYALYAERFFYLPSAGLVWAAAEGMEALRRWRPARAAGVAALAALAAGGVVVSLGLLPDWRDDGALFSSMARRAPRNYMARTQWARRLAHEGRDAEARRELEAARTLDPSRPEVPAIEALLAFRGGEWTKALAAADLAIARGSPEHDPRLLRAAALLSLGRAEEGRRELEELRRRLPGQPAVESLWGQYLLSAGRAAEAYAALARAARLLPGDGAVAHALAMAANDTGRHAEARAVLERLLAREPSHREAWIELARARAALGDAPGAAAAAARAGALPGAAPEEPQR